MSAVFVYRDECKYCQKFKPTIDDIRKTHPEINIRFVNTTSDPLTTARLGISSVPTLIRRAGDSSEIYEGDRSFDHVVNWLKK